MKNTKRFIYFLLCLTAFSCSGDGNQPDAYGNFEADEVTVSAKVSGEIVSLNLEEGQRFPAGEKVGQIDTTFLHLSKLEILSNIELINQQHNNIAAQIQVLEAEKDNVLREVNRLKTLVEKKAATQQQLDEIEGKLNVVSRQIRTLETNNPSVVGQVKVAQAKLKQVDEKISNSSIIHPIDGVVINKIANQHELAGPGTPIYKVADMNTLIFRAYVSGQQLTSVITGQECTVKVDASDGSLMSYSGKVVWIAEEAEFTPKIIQTREERVDMVYAVKVEVPNDGKLKIGMPGELYLKQDSNAPDS